MASREQILYTVNYEKAIQNLTDILIDNQKFQEMCKNMYDAIDTDNEGTLPCAQVEAFVVDFLRGSQKDGEINTDSSKDHEESF